MPVESQSAGPDDWESLTQATINTRRSPLIERVFREFISVVVFYVLDFFYKRAFDRGLRMFAGLSVGALGALCVSYFIDITKTAGDLDRQGNITSPMPQNALDTIGTDDAPKQKQQHVTGPHARRSVDRSATVAPPDSALALCHTLQQMERETGIKLTQADKVRCRAVFKR